jgi:hypothetical protein
MVAFLSRSILVRSRIEVYKVVELNAALASKFHVKAVLDEAAEGDCLEACSLWKKASCISFLSG